MPKILLTVAAMAVIAVVALVALHRFENPKSEYADRQAVVEDDAISRGWIPEFLPLSATDIVEQHPIDESYGYLSFMASSEDIVKLHGICEELAYDDVKYFSSYPLWWPNELTGSNDVSANLDFYLCEEYGVLTSLDGDRMYYWWIN